MSADAGPMEDMNATPLGKLPPPVLQTKQGMPPVEMPNYRDLVNQMETSRAQAPSQHPPPAQPSSQPVHAPSPPPPMHQPTMLDALQQQQLGDASYGMQQQQPACGPGYGGFSNTPGYGGTNYGGQGYGGFGNGGYGGFPNYGGGQGYDYAPASDDLTYAAEDKGGFFAKLVRTNKSTLIVVAVVFLVLLFAVPRLARMPRFGTFDGQLNTLGKAAAAGIAGGAYRLALLAV
jgi:hypothetical protein